MSAHSVLNEFTPATDPDRRGWQVMLAVAWSLKPRAAVTELVEFAILLAGPLALADPRLVEQVALGMLFEREA